MRPPQYAHFDVAPISKRRLRWELAIVLGLTFGYAGVQSIITILHRLSQETALASQTATINRPLAEQPFFDLAYQLLGFVGELAPVALVAYLLWRTAAPHLGNLGLGRLPGRGGRWWLADTGWGVVLAAAIGIPGLAFYLFSRIIGINANVVPTALDAYWWTVPVLILSALRAALGEELIVVAYFFDRMRRLGVGAYRFSTAWPIMALTSRITGASLAMSRRCSRSPAAASSPGAASASPGSPAA
mgnify:CR=1 FL=1